ncbi:MAG: L,D-transpeptidase family protein [Armatimonadetes bacterium]|nr:L,D-transpeptidase family protein [Armatimonadota bacterium]
MRAWVAFFGLVVLTNLGFGQYGPHEVVQDSGDLEGITFASESGKVYLPIRELGEKLRVYIGWDSDMRVPTWDEKVLMDYETTKLPDGTNLIDVSALKRFGGKFEKVLDSQLFTAEYNLTAVTIAIPDQWVEVNLKEQQLRAYQGNRLVLATNISSGSRGHTTPSGEWTTGPEKSAFRRSSKYDDAPMPFSVQIFGGYFIHGSSSVPRYPASHGCIRMPLTGINPAKYFFHWVNKGVSVRINYSWSERMEALMKSGDDVDEKN